MFFRAHVLDIFNLLGFPASYIPSVSVVYYSNLHQNCPSLLLYLPIPNANIIILPQSLKSPQTNHTYNPNSPRTRTRLATQQCAHIQVHAAVVLPLRHRPAVPPCRELLLPHHARSLRCWYLHHGYFRIPLRDLWNHISPRCCGSHHLGVRGY